MRLFSTSLIFVFFTLSLKAQLVGGKFRPGYYFDPDGVKHEGFINQKPSSFSRSAKSANAILFKSGKTGKRELIYATDMQSYVVEADSFAVVTLPSSLNNVRYRIDFARVLFDEKTKVFLIEEKASPSFGLSAGNRGAMPSINLSNYRSRTFLFGNDPDHLELMDKRNYKYVLSSVFAASPELAERVSRLSYDEIEKFSEDYMAGKKAQKQSALKE